MPLLRHMPAFAACLLLCVLPAGAITVRITESDGARIQVSLDQGDVLRIDLPSEPAAAGRQWSMAGHTPAQFATLATTQRVFGGRLSAQGTSSFAWRAVAPGRANVELVYGPSASRIARPERSVHLQVTVSAEAPLRGAESPDAVSETEQAGTYLRTQPCADCTAVKERLTLYTDPRTPLFLLRRIYQDAPGGTLTVIARGAWSTSRGTADPDATIYQLIGSDVAYLLKVEGDRLIPLDGQQIPLPAPAGGDGAFHKVEET